MAMKLVNVCSPTINNQVFPFRTHFQWS